ncbi:MULTISPECIES: P1 family peptidase [Prauserella salsuginis group]|uniref:L-aminopeptidase/D-esterase-like protein n=2 Tax=Prauserella salsuginis group TaxID=2893672 RepID=A0A839XHV1_9PSEU|nr:MULTISPECIES: P1 family peptidase [Prauserella salsuginis group]MBB3661329.1 L-aminopeptidase/D-esterase-like protein [Prauserella sediminis]MCR3719251.1 L-aminopeptidase/D-esterase [Prauserella flava]MCR3735736.1 L-aminopeptidase/D-esterase [Prauserella salsuginis]
MPGEFNAITDVPGVLVGHHHRLGRGWATGATAVLVPGQAVGAVDQRGGAPGTRETDLLAPENLVQRVDAICLSGGSAYGLAAADGVVRWLGERQRGFPVGTRPFEVVPIVPAAVVFDLPRSDWGNRPDATFGYAACEAATAGPVAQGTVGAGTGAQVGSLKGGVGTASERVGEFTVGVLAVVNAAGEAVRTGTGEPLAADHAEPGEFGVARWPRRAVDLGGRAERKDLNTTIGVVATDAELSKAEARRLAVAAQDGLARAVRPAHTMYDGDTVFALATGARPLTERAGRLGGEHEARRAAALDGLCSAAARVFTRAMIHGVLHATSAAGLQAYRDLWPEAFED